MRYNVIDSRAEKHLTSLINWMIDDILGEGGDGDGIWCSKYYNVMSEEFIKVLNEVKPEHWEIAIYEDEKYINFGHGQEWLTITNNEEIYKQSPSWQQFRLWY